ncbi:hypothetical protein CR513_38929, partial [Mucuna pruriens]
MACGGLLVFLTSMDLDGLLHLQVTILSYKRKIRSNISNAYFVSISPMYKSKRFYIACDTTFLENQHFFCNDMSQRENMIEPRFHKKTLCSSTRSISITKAKSQGNNIMGNCTTKNLNVANVIVGDFTFLASRKGTKYFIVKFIAYSNLSPKLEPLLHNWMSFKFQTLSLKF